MHPGAWRYAQAVCNIGDIIIVAVKDAIPNRCRQKRRGRSGGYRSDNKEYGRKDGTYIRFSDNAAVLINDTTNPEVRVFLVLSPGNFVKRNS